MRAVVVTKPVGPRALEVREVPTPEPRGAELLVRVRAAGLNRADLLQARGLYHAPADAPADIPGLEFAGEVAALGPDARGGRRVGDPVFGIVGGGGLAEYLTVHERLAVPVPRGLTWEQAGSIPESFITALDAIDQSGVYPGQSVLVHACAGGVGSAAVQVARAMGCWTVGTSRSPEKLERAADELGLHLGLTTGPAGLAAAIASHTNGRGVAAVIDHLGGAYLVPSLEALAERGTLVLVGLLAGRKADDLGLDLILRKRLRIIGTVLRTRPLEQKIDATSRFAQTVLPWLERGLVRPTIDRVFPLEAIADAAARMESNEVFGKVVFLL